MRKLVFAVLALLLFVAPVSAFSPRDSYLDNVATIAWLDGQNLNVGLGNTSNNRVTVTLSTTTLDAWGRPVFSNRQVNVPARTIIVETLYPSNLGRNEKWNLKVSEGYRSINVPVQVSDVMEIKNYIVEANSDVNVTVDLDILFQGSLGTRLVIDDYYQTADGYNRGSIRISSFEGGLRHIKSSNTIEYVQPYMILNMKAPQVTGLTMMTFSLRKTESGYGWREEEIAGPMIMVYGRNLRFSSISSNSSSDTGRTSR